MKSLLISLPLTLILADSAAAKPVLPVFDPANFEAGAAIDNPYFPLKPGFLRKYSGTTTDEGGDAVEERNVMRYAGPGPVIAGVAATVMTDEAYSGDLIVERTRDYYAQDRAGNVWYLGEEVTNITYDDNDKVTGTDSKGSWLAGRNGALPGYAMPADPRPGFSYEQEHAPADQALDRAEIMALDGKVTVPVGTFDAVLSVFETSGTEPDLREVKYYAKGIGLIREDENVDKNRANPEAHFDLVRKAH